MLDRLHALLDHPFLSRLGNLRTLVSVIGAVALVLIGLILAAIKLLTDAGWVPLLFVGIGLVVAVVVVIERVRGQGKRAPPAMPRFALVQTKGERIKPPSATPRVSEGEIRRAAADKALEAAARDDQQRERIKRELKKELDVEKDLLVAAQRLATDVESIRRRIAHAIGDKRYWALPFPGGVWQACEGILAQRPAAYRPTSDVYIRCNEMNENVPLGQPIPPEQVQPLRDELGVVQHAWDMLQTLIRDLRDDRADAAEWPAPAPGRDRQRVGETHERHIHEWLDVLKNGVISGQPCEYGDLPDGEGHNKRAVAAHFPDLIGSLDEWDKAVARRKAAPVVARERVNDGIGNAEVPDGFGRETVAEAVGRMLVDRVEQGHPDASYKVVLRAVRDEQRDEQWLWSVWLPNGRGSEVKVAEYRDAPVEEIQASIQSDERALQAVVDELRDKGDLSEITESQATLEALRPSVLELLALKRAVSPILFADGCAFCEAQQQGS
jgi:hypothetical protein